MIRAIQQIQLGKVINSEKKARETLRLVKEAGFDGIELNSFMVNKMPLTVRMLTKLAGMPVGKSGRLDWHKLIAESGLAVVSLHKDLGGILNNIEQVVEEAFSYNTNTVVVTGMYFYDYSDKVKVLELCEKLNTAGKLLAEKGIQFLYHNHNCEFRRVDTGEWAYDLIIDNTDPSYVGFEFDSYWAAETGVDAIALMKKLGNRLRLYHINDRGARVVGAKGSILKSDGMELGTGNMNLTELISIAKNAGASAVVLEQHKNFVDKDPIKSFQLSANYLNKHVQ